MVEATFDDVVVVVGVVATAVVAATQNPALLAVRIEFHVHHSKAHVDFVPVSTAGTVANSILPLLLLMSSGGRENA